MDNARHEASINDVSGPVWGEDDEPTEPTTYLVGDEPPHSRMRIIEVAREGEHHTVYEILVAPSLTEAMEWATLHRPAYRCAHAYDCCGHYYPSDAEVVGVGEHRYLITQGWSQNV